MAPGETVTSAHGDTNPCTGDTLDADAVANGEEPCQADRNFKVTQVDGT